MGSYVDLVSVRRSRVRSCDWPEWGPHNNDKKSHYAVDGVDAPIYDQNRNFLPSQGGDYWIFYRDKRKQCAYPPGAQGSLCTDEPQSNVLLLLHPDGFLR